MEVKQEKYGVKRYNVYAWEWQAHHVLLLHDWLEDYTVTFIELSRESRELGKFACSDGKTREIPLIAVKDFELEE